MSAAARTAADAVVIFHTGTPSAGIMFEPMVAGGRRPRDAACRLLAARLRRKRPPAGPHRRRLRRAKWSAIADELGIGRFYTVGWSGGGPHALACAALLGDRVIAAATLASVAPHDAEGLDWLAGMGEENLQEFAAAESGQLIGFLDRMAAEYVARQPGADPPSVR